MFCPNCGHQNNDGAKFCNECGERISINDTDTHSQQPDARIQCPSCGMPLSAFDAICPACGTENVRGRPAQTIQELSEQLKQIQSKLSSSENASATSSTDGDPAFHKMATCIQTFVIPNTKSDILEFMIMASANIDPRSIGQGDNGFKVTRGQGYYTVAKAWYSKFEQAYQKASITLSNDSSFQKIKSLYEQKTKEVEEAIRGEKKSVFMLFAILFGIPIIITLFIVILYIIMKDV